MGRGGEEMQGPSSVRMTSPSVLALGIVLSLIPGWVWSDITRGTRGVEVVHQLAHKSAHHLHRRMKRGWIWKQLFVPEEDPTPRVIGQLKSDYDQDEFTIKYILSGEGAGDVFEIDEYSGEIRTLARLDREAKAFYVLQAQAINRRSSEPVEPQSEFIIKVQDINDNVPVFQNEPYVSSVPEMCPIGTTVAQVTATDADDPLFGNNAKLIYSILQGEPYFSVEPKTGMVVTSWPNMDREAREEYLVVVQVKDMLGLSGGYSASTTVTVSLTDVNDNGPTFQHNLYTFAVSEGAPVGTTVGRIMADDGDVGINARMSYSLEDLEESATFTIHTDPATQEGVVVLAKPLDYESKRRFVMAAEAVNDHVDPRFLSDMVDLRDRCTLRVVVEDVDEPPIFLDAAPYEWKVPENAAAGTVVGTVSARDTDSVNNPVRYAIDRSSDVRKAFKIDPNNGTLTVAKPLDRETANWHNLTVSATETKQARLSSSVSVFIKVLDINDNVPRLARDYQPYICEGTQAGEVIQLLSAVDPDDPVEGHHFYFSMVPERHINPNFTIRDNQDNTAGVVARRSTFTRKDRTQYLLPVVVSDSGSPALSSTSTLLVSVCSCQPAGHCPTGAGGGGVEALALSMGVSLRTLLALLVCLATLTGLSVLTLMLWSRRRRRRRKQQQQQEAGEEEGDLELPDRFSQKVLRYGEPPGGCRGVGVGAGAAVGQPVPLRRPHPHHHPRRREQRRLRRADVAASVRMSSLRQSHLIGPEDDVFRQFIVDRLAEADADPGAPPFDCPRSYAYEGSGATPVGSLSSLESCTSSTTVDATAAVPEWPPPPPPCINAPNIPPPPPGPPPPPPRPFLVRLTPWYGAGEEETIF